MRLIRHIRPIQPMLLLKRLLALFLACTITITIYIFGPWAHKAEAAWWNENWLYRTSIPITTHSGAESNVYVIFFIDTATPIAASKMQSDCGDLRFTKADGTMLKYYIGTHNSCNSTTTEVHVLFNSFPAGSQTIYYYYGNPSAPNGFSGSDFGTISTYQGNTTYQVSSAAANNEMGSVTNAHTILRTATESSLVDNGKTDAGQANVLLIGNGGTDNNLIAGFRFTSVGITQGSTVNVANFSLTSAIGYDATVGNATHHINYYVSAQAADNASALTTTNGDLDSSGSNTRVRSTAFSTWDQTATVANTEYSVGVTSVIQEIVNRVGFASGNAINMLLDIKGADQTGTGNTANSEWQDYYSYTKDSTKAAKLFVIWTTPSLVIGSAGSEESSPGVAAYWKFDEGYGTTTSDSGTNQATGTLAGTTKPTWQTEDQCVSGKCLFFNGTTSSVTVSTTISGVKSVSLWVRPNTVSSGALIDLNGTARVTVSSGVLSATGFTSPTIYVNGVVSTTLTANTWQLVTVTTSTAVSASAIKIGNYSATYLQGFIDDVKLFQNVRSVSQIKDDYAAAGTGQGGNVLGVTSQAFLSNGLTGYWKMDESSWATDCSTTSVTDSSGNGNNGKPCPNASAAAITTAGKFGNAGSFDGTNDYVSVADANTLDVTSSDSFTVSAWVNVSNTTSDGEIIAKKASLNATDIGWSLTHWSNGNGGDICLDVADGTNQFDTCTKANVLTASTWYHVVAVFDRNNANTSGVYINGVRDVSGGVSLSPSSIGDASNSAFVGIGILNTGFFWNGKLDDVRFYKRAFSPNEVSQLYNYAPGPVGLWKLDEKTGTTAADSSGYANSGTWSGTGTHTALGKIGSAGNFNGTDDYVSVASSNSLNLGTSGTVEAWVNPSQYASGIVPRIIVNKGGFNADLNDFAIDFCSASICGTDMVEYYIANGSTHNTVNIPISNFPLNTWTHTVMTWDGTTLKAYVNGVLKTSTAQTVNPTTSGSALGIGVDLTDGNIDFFPGKLDQVQVYNYARSQKQIIQDMNGGHPAPGSPIGSPLGYWKLNEGYGTTANNSGNGGTVLNGTVTNVTQSGTSTNSGSGWTTAGKFGKAVNFEGTAGSSNDLINLGSDSSIDDLTGNPMSLSAWIYPNSLGEGSAGVIMAKNGNATTPSAGWLWQLTSTSNLKFSVDGTTDLVVTSTGNPITLGTWNYVTLTWDGTFTDATTVHMYVNGKEVKYGTQTNGASRVSDAANSLLIGNNNATGTALTFDGTIDEVKVFTGQLTADQVKIDYNRGASQVLGALGNNSSYAPNASNQEYCVPGDSTSCAPPIGEWKFEEHTGTTANDTSGHGNTGTLTNGPAWTSGKIGSGINFKVASSQYVNVPTNSSLNITGPLTISAWVNANSFQTSSPYVNGIVDKGLNSTKSYFLRLTDDGTTNPGYPEFAIVSGGNDQGVVGTYRLNANTWYFLEGVYDGTNAKLYINGVLNNAANIGSFTLDSANDPLRIGWNYDGRYFDGVIDQVRVFNYARTAVQAAWDYNHGGPVGWWKMDECQGSSLYDSSGNGLTGTVTIGGFGTNTGVGDCNTSASTSFRYSGKSGRFNYSGFFDGSGDYAEIPDNSLLDPTSQVSVSMWLYPTTSNTFAYPLAKCDTATCSTIQYNIYIDGSGHLEFLAVDAGQSAVATSTLTSNTWYHVVGTYDGSTAKLYINGALAASAAESGAISTTTGALSIGRSTGQNIDYFTGRIDDVKVFNYALTPTQVKTQYNDGASVLFAPITGAP